MYIFISHSSKDAVIAEKLCTVIENNYSECFLSSRDILPGQEYASALIDALDRSDLIVLVLSGAAVSSPHVLREIERAVSKSIPILVYKLEEVVLPKSFEYFLMTHQWLEADPTHYDRLLNYINSLSNDAPAEVTHTPDSVSRKKKIRFCLLFVVLFFLILAGFFLSRHYFSSGHASKEESGQPVLYQPGDTIFFGTYHDAPIEWQVLSLSDDGTKALLITTHILTFKAFDGADSGVYHPFSTSTDGLGNNSWITSSIRTWLNSADDTVVYEGNPPVDTAMSDLCNAYDAEAGFLSGFSQEEKNAILETTLLTNGHSHTDKVFLLSAEDFSLFESSGVSLAATPTKEALIYNESSFYSEYCQGVFQTDASPWWLRDAADNSTTAGQLVYYGLKPNLTLDTATVCADGYGIRPAIFIDLSSVFFQ